MSEAPYLGIAFYLHMHMIMIDTKSFSFSLQLIWAQGNTRSNMETTGERVLCS